MNITAVFAKMERETLTERVKDNMMLLAKTGHWLDGVPTTRFNSETKEVIFESKIKKI